MGLPLGPTLAKHPKNAFEYEIVRLLINEEKLSFTQPSYVDETFSSNPKMSHQLSTGSIHFAHKFYSATMFISLISISTHRRPLYIGNQPIPDSIHTISALRLGRKKIMASCLCFTCPKNLQDPRFIEQRKAKH